MDGTGTHPRLLALLTVIAFAWFHTVQAQDQKPPVWDKSSVAPLKLGIREDTKIGASIAQLKCNDENGDRILYSRIKGNAVIVSKTGLVVLAVELDFEKTDTIGYHVAFGCVDIDEFGFPIHNVVDFELELTIDDANDMPPTFTVNSKEGYAFGVSEDASIGYELKPLITVIDEDTSDNAVLKNLYLICNSPNPDDLVGLPETSISTCTKFRLTYSLKDKGLYEAKLALIAPLDYETKKVYTSKIVAIDNPKDASMRLSTTINIQINIQDAQDMGPVFVNPGASAIVSEGASPGDLVNLAISARDGDTGDKRPLTIVMLQDEKDAFTLDPAAESTSEAGVYAARLRVKNALDREEILGSYQFVVKVIEMDKTTGAETTATATATYSVQISDIDDEPPKFEEELYMVEVTEMEYTKEAVQITGLRMVCTDADEPRNGRYTVSIQSQSFEDVFSISPGVSFTSSAILFLTVNDVNYMDYDVPEYRTQTVVLVARSIGSPPLSSSTTVSILLTDINDNRPVFVGETYDLSVSESITVDQLPYEITTIRATDNDSGPNGKVTYRLEGGTSSKFEINSDTGLLTLVNKVDFETTPFFVFLVFATDSGRDKKTSQVQVTVEVTNTNDLAPIFSQDLYTSSVNEDDLDFLTPVVISATDTEVGTNTITYRIIDGQTDDNAFSLDSTSGKLFLVKSLKYKEDGYKLTIQASDNGSPPQFSQVGVEISVIDQNNFNPEINPKTYFKTLSETAPPGTSVATILGSDKDEGEFGKISYRIVSGAYDNFVIDQDLGLVTVNDPQTFDYDFQKSYNIEITGSDGGAPQLFDTAFVKVTITDANNKKPSFVENIYIKTVDEKEPINFSILKVSATDPDSVSELVYSIKEGTITARNSHGNTVTSIFPYNYKEAIGIRPNSGEVYIKNKLNKEEALEVSFIAQVEDIKAETPGQIDTTRVAITVQGDVNTDLSFDRIEQSNLNEGSTKGYDITTVVARDPTTQDSITNYVLIGTSDFFEVIKTTGEIKLKKEIDYDKDPHLHELVVMAIANDGVRSASATVTIKVKDDNDLAPVFSKPEYVTSVDEDAPALTKVETISAKDYDTASFGPIEYKIAGGLDSDHFELYKTSRGVDVLIARGVELDYNTRDYYELDIIAMDNPYKKFSTVQQFSSVKLKITVIDKNNHAPEFQEDEAVRKMAVAETAPLSKSIGSILATDKDFELNGEVSYFLKAIDHPSSQRGIQLFTIVPRSGVVRVARSLLGFGGNVYKMEVFAQDGGTPFLSNTFGLEIEVLKTENNDGNPKWYFPPNNYVLYAKEETSNYVIQDQGKVEFFDVTPRTGNGIRFVLSPRSDSASSFRVDSLTGKITVVDALDRELKDSYNLLVYAEDTENRTEIRTGRQIIIRLDDEDDNEPVFTNPKNYPQCGEAVPRPFEISFFENLKAGEVVYTVRACDPDSNPSIYYYTYDDEEYCKVGNDKSKLRVETDGRLVTKEVIDYEVDKSFIMCVRATSTPISGRKKRAAFDLGKLDAVLDHVIYLLIHVMDKNDNSPKFPRPSVTTVMHTDARDYPVVVLDASDIDGKGYNIPVYTIVETKFYVSEFSAPIYPGRAFVIENNELKPDPPRGQTFQDFSGGRFVLTIRAEDPVDPTRYDTQTVSIYVHEKGQAMKVILDLTTSEGFSLGEKIVADLNAVSSRYVFQYLHVSVHNDKDGIDRSRTDVCFVAVDSLSHNILNINELLDMLQIADYKVVLNKPDFEIVNPGKCYPSTSSEEQVKWRDLWWVLVVLAIFIAVCAIFFIIIICFMHRRYRRYMETEKTYLEPQ